MALSLKVDLSAYPKGKPLGFNGLGVVNNGETVNISPQTEQSFYAETGKVLTDSFKDQEGISLTGSAEFAPPRAETPKEDVPAPAPTEEKGSEE